MFDSKKLMKDKLKPREETIKVEELKDYFEGAADWTVRGLSGQELHKVRDASDRDDTVKAALSALYGGKSEKTDGFRELFGFGDGITEEYSKRIELLMAGTVTPEIDRQTAVMLMQSFPATVTALTDRVLALTSLGHVPGKRKDSTKKSG